MRRFRLRFVLLILVSFFAAITIFQIVSGAVEAAFGAYPDEPYHFASALMIRDWVREGCRTPPLEFAQAYYQSRPAFAVGYWPPLFYVIEAAWLLIFEPSRASALALIALFGATLLAALCLVVWRTRGPVAALAASAGLALAPIFGWSLQVVMTDLALALTSFAAVVAWGWYLEREKTAAACAAGLLAAAALLTKTAAVHLAPAFVLSALLVGGIKIFRKPATYLPLAITLVLCGPWYAYAWDFLDRGLLPEGHRPNALAAGVWALEEFVRAAGPFWIALAVCGAWFALRRRDPLWTVAAFQIVSLVALIIAAPVNIDTRYFLPALPALIALGTEGAFGIAAAWARRRDRPATARPAALAALSLVALTGLAMPAHWVDSSRSAGAADASALLVHRTPRDARVLIVGSSIDGPLVVQAILEEGNWPGRTFLRATKVLVDMDWNGRSYRMLADSEEEVLGKLERLGVQGVLIDLRADPYERPHRELVWKALRHSSRWKLAGSFGKTGADYQVFVPKGFDAAAARSTALDAQLR